MPALDIALKKHVDIFGHLVLVVCSAASRSGQTRVSTAAADACQAWADAAADRKGGMLGSHHRVRCSGGWQPAWVLGEDGGLSVRRLVLAGLKTHRWTNVRMPFVRHWIVDSQPGEIKKQSQTV